jgi:hypothetical protein
MSESTAAATALLGAADNPFADPVARLDRPTPPPNVDEIHAHVRKAILAAIGRTRTAGQSSMIVVTGDPGQGKTHQLAWLRHEAEVSNGYYFVEIPPLKDVDAPFAHILRFMVQGLLAHRAGATNSLVRLLWECLRKVGQAVLAHAREVGDDATAERLARVIIGDDHFIDTFGALVVDDPTLGQLLHANGRGLPPLTSLMSDLGRGLCRFTDPAVQPAFFDWLRGAELPDEDLQLLGIKRSVETEDRSFEVLRGILSLSSRPIALCLDQLEATGQLLGDAGATALATALMEVYQQVPVCIVLMAQTQFWGTYRTKFPQAAIDRMETLLLPLPRPEEAERLISTRLSGLWRFAGVEAPYPTYPFARSYIGGMVTALRPTIRTVLTECKNQLERMRGAGSITEVVAFGQGARTAAPARVGPALESALETKVRGLAGGSLGQPGGREPYLRTAILRMLGLAGERRRKVGTAQVGAIEDPPKPRNGPRPPASITLALPDGARRVAIDVNSSDARGAWRVLDRLKRKVEAKEADTGVLIREADAPIGDGAKQTLALVRELEQTGGGLVYVERDVAHRLVGAELLLDAVAAADIAAGDRIVSHDEAITFLLEQDLAASALAPLFSRIARPTPQPMLAKKPAEMAPAGDLEAAVLRLLGSESAVMAAGTLAKRLGVEVATLDGPLASLAKQGFILLGRDRKRELTVCLVVAERRA